jgi:1-phosphofructokinase family hexose kinase
MIVAAGLTPAWQQIMRSGQFRVGEVNRAEEVHWCASGKVLNVAVALAHLEEPCQAVALLGGAPRAAIDREFDALGIARQWVQSQAATRVCTTILDDASGQTTELVENAGPVAAAELDEFARVYARSVVDASAIVLTGSLPTGTPKDFYRTLLEHTACPVVLDARGEELLQALDQRPLVVKPNREELAITLGRSLDSTGELLSAMRELNQRGADWVVVSQGKEAIWATSAGKAFRLQPPTVPVVNPIGSGDCLAAGMGSGIASGLSLLDAIRLGAAAAIENVGQLLPGRIQRTAVIERAERLEIVEVDVNGD